MVLIDNEFAQVSMNKSYIFIKYKKFCPSKDFRVIWAKILSNISEYEVVRFLVDSRDMGVIAPKDQQWVVKEVGLRAKSIESQSYSAIIVEDNIFAKSSMDSAIRYADDTNPNLKRNIEYFDSFKEAEKWLTNIE